MHEDLSSDPSVVTRTSELSTVRGHGTMGITGVH